MAIFTWRNGVVPEGMKIKQVYGIIFTSDGRTLLRIEEKNNKKVHSLAGGTPETFDADMEATLRRELVEEVNVTIEKPILVGYMEVDEENGIPPYAQVRMTAMISDIGPTKPDPDNGETYERILVSPQKAIELLNWGKPGEEMIKAAVKAIIKEKGLSIKEDKEIIKIR